MRYSGGTGTAAVYLVLDSDGLWTMLISAFSLVLIVHVFTIRCPRLPVSSALLLFSLLLLILLSDDAKFK